MKVIINLIKGFANTRKSARMVLLLLLINLAFSIALALPLYHSLKDSFGDSLVADRMAEGFDYLWWEEFRDEAKGLEKTFTPSIIGKGAVLNNLEGLLMMRFLELPSILIVIGLLYIILHTFLAGGILSTLNKEKVRFSMGEFFEGAGSYFFRFFLLMLLSWLFFILFPFVSFGILGTILENVRENAFSEITPFYLGLVFNAVVLFLFLFIQMVFDYGRIKIVMEGKRNILRAALGAFGFVFRHLGSTLTLFYLLFLVQVAVTLVYILIQGFIPQSQFWGILMAFLFQQLFIFSLIWVRCWLYSSQMEFYRYLL